MISSLLEDIEARRECYLPTDQNGIFHRCYGRTEDASDDYAIRRGIVLDDLTICKRSTVEMYLYTWIKDHWTPDIWSSRLCRQCFCGIEDFAPLDATFELVEGV